MFVRVCLAAQLCKNYRPLPEEPILEPIRSTFFFRRSQHREAGHTSGSLSTDADRLFGEEVRYWMTSLGFTTTCCVLPSRPQNQGGNDE